MAEMRFWGYVAAVGQLLLGVLRQAVAAVAEGGGVVARADARLQADPADDVGCVEPARHAAASVGTRTSVGIQAVPFAFPRVRLA